jgi:hypothetical protein
VVFRARGEVQGRVASNEPIIDAGGTNQQKQPQHVLLGLHASSALPPATTSDTSTVADFMIDFGPPWGTLRQIDGGYYFTVTIALGIE